MSNFTFTSESVTEGHPDKVADSISDAVLDALIAQDPKSRVAVETLVTTGLVVVAGEVTTEAYAEIGKIARPKNVWIVADMPKTRSGKIMRRVLKARALGMDEGDLTTLEE